MENRYGYDGAHSYTPTINQNDDTSNSIILSFSDIMASRPYEQIMLFPCQIDCYNKCLSLFKTQKSVFNASPTRSGKTITTLAQCSTLGLNPMVIGPSSIKASWDKETRKYGFFDYLFISYDSLAGKTKKLNHPYLVIHNDEYYPTEHLRNIIKQGIMIIMDESHLTKNPKSRRNKACHAIVNCLYSMESKSKLTVMSATPYDKIKFSESVLKILGIIKHSKMYEYDRSTASYVFDGYGFGELIRTCNMIDQEKTSEILSGMKKINNTTIGAMCHSLFIELIKPKYITRIDPVFPTKVDARNGYFKISKEAERNIAMLEGKLIDVTGYDKNTGQMNEKIDMGAVLELLHNLERIKLEIIERLAINMLYSVPNSKLVIYLWYRDTTNMLAQKLAYYKPGIINGETAVKKRSDITDKFQEPNGDCRVLIGHPDAGGLGLALDDQHGGWPRTILMMADYRFISMAQALARCLGMLAKSNSNAWVVFANMQEVEQNILEKLSDKEKVVRDVVGYESKIITPGNLEIYRE